MFSKKYSSVLFLIVISYFLYLGIGYLIEEQQKSEKETTPEKFLPESKPSGHESEYIIDLKLNSNGKLQIHTTVNIINTSSDTWNSMIFYFIPNMFTKENSPELSKPATHDFHRVSINGNMSDFHLMLDTLTIPLNESLEPGQEIKVQFIYDLTMPEEGLRFRKENENYYLAQFYPMIATYRDHQWNKKPYLPYGETYHTSFSDIIINYDIPDDYTIASTSDKNRIDQSQDTLLAKNVKEVFIALLKNPEYVTVQNDHTTIRVFGNNQAQNKEIANEAENVFSFYEDIIGPYPFQQLDIVIGTMGMEYPGIVTIGDMYDKQMSSDHVKQMVAHEIAHQWFYGVINNDPYHDAWLDEGFATFAQGLYYYSTSKEEPDYDEFSEQLESLKEYPIDLPLNQYPNNPSNYIYGKSTAMLWKLFEHRGGIEKAEDFLKDYFQYYKYKEIDTKEFIRFAEYYFDTEFDSFFNQFNIFN